MEQTPEERKVFLSELNQIATYTGTVLHGDDLTKVRVRQLKKYFNKTYKMLHRLSVMQGEITHNSFKYGYGGKILCRKVLLEIGTIEKQLNPGRAISYRLMITPDEITLELVSRIIVEVYLLRNEIQPL